MLSYDETYSLIGIIVAHALMTKDDQAALAGMLSKVTLMLNRQGKVSKGLVNLIKYVGLAASKDFKPLAAYMSRNPNPLLGQDAVKPNVPRFAKESQADFDARVKKINDSWETYKPLYDKLKNHKTHFDELDTAIKTKIRTSVLRYSFGQ